MRYKGEKLNERENKMENAEKEDNFFIHVGYNSTLMLNSSFYKFLN